MNSVRLGYIGEDPEEVEFEPLTEPLVVPEPTRQPARQPEKQPA